MTNWQKRRDRADEVKARAEHPDSMYRYCKIIGCRQPARAGTDDGLDRRYCRRGVVTLTGASHSLANSAPRSGRHARTLPNLERCCSKLLVYGPFEEMALVVEGVVCRGVDVQEALR